MNSDFCRALAGHAKRLIQVVIRWAMTIGKLGRGHWRVLLVKWRLRKQKLMMQSEQPQ